MSLSTASCLSRGMGCWQGLVGCGALPCCKVSSLGVKEAAVALSLAAHRFGRRLFFFLKLPTFFFGSGDLQPWKSSLGGNLNKKATGKGYDFFWKPLFF